MDEGEAIDCDGRVGRNAAGECSGLLLPKVSCVRKALIDELNE